MGDRDAPRARREVIFGSPGCGKTTALLARLAEVLATGTPADRIGFVTFTRAARKEVRDRVGWQLPFRWLRTIHSAAYVLLGLTPEGVMNPKRWREFAARYHYRLTDYVASFEDEPAAVPCQTEDDLCRYVHDWGRNRRLDWVAAAARCPVERLDMRAYELFVQRLEGFKKEHGLLDFNDFLEAVLAEGLCPEIDVLFIDEAQDLSPLQIAVVESWAAKVSRTYVAGDDDQAIYGFQGADPAWLVSLAANFPTTILSQSHRVPGTVHGLAQRIIARNRERVPKAYLPTGIAGEVLQLDRDRALQLLDGSRTSFVLARNRVFLTPWARELADRAVVFVVEGRGGLNPLGDAALVTAVRTAIALSDGVGRMVPAEDLAKLLLFVPLASGLLPRGAKTRVQELTGPLPHEYIAADLGLAALINAIRRGGPLSVLSGTSEDTCRYLAQLLQRTHDIPQPRVILTSIHGAKGREADLVVVVPDMTAATFNSYERCGQFGTEGENRVFYVAVTRARQTLVIAEPSTRRHFRFPQQAQSVHVGEHAAVTPQASWNHEEGEGCGCSS